jgi:hypothetical protein
MLLLRPSFRFEDGRLRASTDVTLPYWREAGEVVHLSPNRFPNYVQHEQAFDLPGRAEVKVALHFLDRRDLPLLEGGALEFGHLRTASHLIIDIRTYVFVP